MSIELVTMFIGGGCTGIVLFSIALSIAATKHAKNKERREHELKQIMDTTDAVMFDRMKQGLD